MDDESEGQFVELEVGDGTMVRCEVLEILPFRGKEYAALLLVETEDLVVMEFIPQEEGGLFREIADDAEFEEVSAYVQMLIDEEEDAEGEDDEIEGEEEPEDEPE